MENNNSSNFKILVVTPFNEKEWRWHTKNIPGYMWKIRNLDIFGKKSWFWMLAALPWAIRAKRFDLVVTHHAQMSLCMAFWMKLFNIRIKHLAYGFNHGDGRFFEGLHGTMAKWAFKDMWGVVVYSIQERELYSERYGIPQNKFSFVHWAVDDPSLDQAWLQATQRLNPYVCSMGRNNRDWGLLMNTAKDIACDFIVVCDKGALDKYTVPKNVTVYHALTSEQCASILKNAIINVITLKDDSRGTGHVTIVNSMKLGTPFVVTDNKTIADYFLAEQHGLIYSPGNPDSMRGAIETLLLNVDLRQAQSSNCKIWADKWFSADASQRALEAILQSCRAGAELPPAFPPDWLPQGG
jgi:glycosyltransferase involved in cell wall biosynthesis